MSDRGFEILVMGWVDTRREKNPRSASRRGVSDGSHGKLTMRKEQGMEVTQCVGFLYSRHEVSRDWSHRSK